MMMNNLNVLFLQSLILNGHTHISVRSQEECEFHKASKLQKYLAIILLFFVLFQSFDTLKRVFMHNNKLNG